MGWIDGQVDDTARSFSRVGWDGLMNSLNMVLDRYLVLF